MPSSSDGTLRELLAQDPERGWRLFIDEYTPLLLSAIAQAGISRRDDAMDVYVRTCERLAADDCARLRRHDPTRGSLSAWLRTVVRHVVVDWVRSRAGRRRFFRSIKALPAFEREVFELFYWHERTPAEMAEMMCDERGRPAGLARVLQALERIEEALTARQRGELLALAARRPPLSLDDDAASPPEPADERADPELALSIERTRAALASALAALEPEDALIVSLKYLDGLSDAQVERSLHIERLTPARTRAILGRLSALLAPGVTGAGDPVGAEAAVPGGGVKSRT